MVAELATNHSKTGGAYIWAEKAFGPKTGFFLVSLLWIANLLWYPSFLLVIAANFAYLFDPTWAQDKIFLMTFGVVLFWTFTVLNCKGVKFSSLFSEFCSVVGIMLPIVIIIAFGLFYFFSGKVDYSAEKLFSFDLGGFENPQYLVAIVGSLFGIEVSAVHAGDVIKPKRDYPISLLISGFVILILLLLSELAISWVVSVEELSFVTGLYDAVAIFFKESGIEFLIWPVLFLIFLGNVGSFAAWMMGSTRGILVASQHNHVAKILQKTNKNGAPVGVLLLEAVIFTLASSVILMFPRIIDSLWLLLALAAQISLLYYAILFICAIRLRYKTTNPQGFVIPGGKLVLWIVMGLGVFTSLLCLAVGFITPADLDNDSENLFRYAMTGGLILAVVLPLLLLLFKRKETI
jgi:amino acid transporter